MTANLDKAGWGKSPISRKWHYFPAGEDTSLCKTIGFYFGEREEGNDDSTDNCIACKKHLLRHK